MRILLMPLVVATSFCLGVAWGTAEPLPEAPEPVVEYVELTSADIEEVPVVIEEPQLVGRYDELALSEEDIDMLAKIIYLEARGEEFTGQVAVAEVVLNRCLSPDFPNTVPEVIYQEGQFEPAPYINTVQPSETQYAAITTALTPPDYVVTEETVFFARRAITHTNVVQIGAHYFSEADK